MTKSDYDRYYAEGYNDALEEAIELLLNVSDEAMSVSMETVDWWIQKVIIYLTHHANRL